jgi:oxygen-dependent protoporphyrinogen oxidase
MDWPTKLRMCLEPFIAVGPAEPEESLSAFIARRAGRGIARDLLPAMVAGILAAPAEVLAVDAIPRLRQWESHGSLFAGIRKGGLSHLMVPEGGMGALTTRLAERLPGLRTGLMGRALWPLPGGRWRVSGAGQTREVDQVVLALPAHEAVALLGPVAPIAAAPLEGISYTSLSLYHSRHAPCPMIKDSFGFLIHPPESDGYLGSLVPSWIDPGSVPADLMQLRSFVGDGALWGARIPDHDMGPWVEARLRRWVPSLGEPVQVREERVERAIPRPEMGHRARVKAAVEALPEGLHWISNARFGPGVRDVIEGVEAWIAARQA